MVTLKQFYEDIGYEPYQEIRVLIGKYWKSFYPKNFKETAYYLSKYSNNNCYVGVNPRKDKGQSSSNVAYRRMMVFDIEHRDKKPSLEDKNYMSLLEESIKIVRKIVFDEIGIKVTYIVSSGRGVHLYFKIKPLVIEYQPAYIDLYNYLIKKINYKLKKLDMKADPPVKDLPRIFGAPGTKNIKYSEKTSMRKILKHYLTNNDITTTIVNIQTKKLKHVGKKNIVSKNSMSINDIRNSWEYKFFQYGAPTGTLINNRLRWPLKLLMRKGKLSYEDTEVIAKEIAVMKDEAGKSYGYKSMYLSDEEYVDKYYSVKSIQRWSNDNYEWMVRNSIDFPYLKRISYDVEENDSIFEVFVNRLKIDKYEDLIDMIIEYNNATVDDSGYKHIFYIDNLKRYIVDFCNDTLVKYIFDSGLFDVIKYTRGKFVDDRDDFRDLL